ncbi:hypothetical protein [Natronococcus roseus]|uniref:hypothetical protein n=1 Tax=Natronococcus roseus TaxID=1052014 RepID=UPI00374D33BC
MCEKGIFYIATGEEYTEEAAHSAKSVKSVLKNIPVAIATDQDEVHGIFDTKVKITDSNSDFSDQINNLSKSPFKKTIHLDTDIYADEPFEELFDVLTKFDIAAAHNHDRSTYEVTGVPSSFPEYNTGVLAYINSKDFSNFLSTWNSRYKELLKEENKQNQPSFRKALYESDLRIATLPPEYNLMTRYPGHAVGSVKLFHGRLIDFDADGAGRYHNIYSFSNKINSTDQHRVFTQLGGLNMYTNKENSILHKYRLAVQRHGILEASRRSIEKILNGRD